MPGKLAAARQWCAELAALCLEYDRLGKELKAELHLVERKVHDAKHGIPAER